MRFEVFQYRIPIDGQPDDLNRFLASNRVANVNQYVAETAGGAMLVFIVEVVGSCRQDAARFGKRVDYKEVLSPADFVVFSHLRSLRKQLAEAEGVPLFAIFTNAQLAAMAHQRPKSLAELEQIEGIGHAKIRKYGEGFLQKVLECLESQNGAKD